MFGSEAIKRISHCSLQSADNLIQQKVDFWKRKTKAVPPEEIPQVQEGPLESTRLNLIISPIIRKKNSS